MRDVQARPARADAIDDDPHRVVSLHREHAGSRHVDPARRRIALSNFLLYQARTPSSSCATDVIGRISRATTFAGAIAEYQRRLTPLR
jgi:hypothetical protein